MNNYEILTIKNEKYKYVVLATSYMNPIDELYNIEDDLRQKEFVGEVMFDLLFCNGITNNRYLEVYFNGYSFDVIKSRVLDDVDVAIKETIYSFYISNKNMLEYSSLLKAEQFLFKKKLIM